MQRLLLIAGSCAALVSSACLVPAAAPAMGLPGTFPRAIVTTGTGQGVRVTRFTVVARAVGTKRIRVTVRVSAARISAAMPTGLTIAVGPCTAGTSTSPYCKPTATTKLALSTTAGDATRAFLVARPAARHDALRVTLTAAGKPIPYQTSNVGGGGGTAELLLNGGTWRYRQGTAWGLVATPPAGVAFNHVLFNSRRYEWAGVSQTAAAVTTTIGYQGVTPRWTFANTMKAGLPFSFYRTPSQPVQAARPAPRVLAYGAALGSRQLFQVTIPLAAWKPA